LRLAEVVTSGLTVMALIRKAGFGISVADYFYFMAQVRGMALEESLGAPALELYVEGTGLRYAIPLDELGVFGPPLAAFREISRSRITSNVIAVPDGTMVSDQGKTIGPVRLRAAGDGDASGDGEIEHHEPARPRHAAGEPAATGDAGTRPRSRVDVEGQTARRASGRFPRPTEGSA